MMGEREGRENRKVFIKYKIEENEPKTKVSYPKKVKAVTSIFPPFPHPLIEALNVVLLTLGNNISILNRSFKMLITLKTTYYH